MVLLPAIDIKDGRCVRLLKGDFQTSHQVADDPVEVAKRYREASARFIHVVDLDGALHGERRNAALVRRIVEAAAPAKVELGGGLRCMDDLLEADSLGVYRFVIGSAAVSNPDFVKEAVQRFGERVAVGIDAQNGFIKTHGWTNSAGLDECEFAKSMENLGVKCIIYTDIDTDGMLSGPSWDRLKTMRSAVGCTLIASGGVTSLEDVKRLRSLGLDGAIAGKALYTGHLPLEEAVWEARIGALFVKSELVPCIIQHADSGEALMLGYANFEAFKRTLSSGLVWFWSRSRQKLWQKGETSGNVLRVVSVFADCDEDTVLIKCHPAGPVCHTGRDNCFFYEMEIHHEN